MILDFVAFEEAVYKASCEALGAIREDCQTETLYSFGLITNGLFGYIFPNANTEEGVVRAANEIVQAKGFHGELEIALKCAQWEPSVYWHFFGKQNSYFEGINNMLDQVNIQDALCNLSHAEFDSTTEKLEGVLLNVLSRLRENGCFGKVKDDFYTNISYQDQTFEDLHRCALRVNSGEVCNRMWNDLSDVLELWNSKNQEAG